MMMQPSPTIDRAYYLLLQEERQRSIQIIAQYPSDSSSFVVPGQYFGQGRQKPNPNRGNGAVPYKNN